MVNISVTVFMMQFYKSPSGVVRLVTRYFSQESYTTPSVAKNSHLHD